MADDTRTANVELTADVSQYSAQINQAYEQTNLLIKSVNQLSTSLEGMTKKIGKRLLIFTAADVAMVTGMVALTARYEKQMATLRAQTELTNKSFQTYKSGISDLSKQLPKTRGELVQLVTQIEHLGITSERESLKMAKVFTNLAGATGEDVSGLTQGMIELGRAMGTLGGGAGMMENFTDSLVKVAAESGVAAQSVVNFANSISPFARAAGIGEAALLGISAAFTRAGADGYAAANTFNTIVADITRQIQNGSPEIAKYASAIGVTAEQFKKMDMTERITQIFEAVNKAGPQGIRIMDQLGQDGIRAARSIQQVSNEAGGLRQAIETSVKAYGGGSTQTGADAAFDTLDSKLSMLRNNMDILGSAIGEAVLPPAKALLNVFNNMVTSVSGFLAPLLSAAGLMGAVLAPFTAAAGTLMNLMGPLSTLMMGFMAMRLSPLKAFGQGAREGVLVKQGIQGLGPVTDMGRRMAAWEQEVAAAQAAGRAPNAALRPAWYQRAGFRLGEMAGATQAGVGVARFTPPSLRAVGTGAFNLTGSVARGYREWYQDAALRGNDVFDRRSMARALETPISRVGGLFGAARTALTDPNAQGGMWKTFKTELDNSNAAIKANAAANAANSTSKAANTTATTSNTTSLLQRVKQEVAAAGTMEAFTLSVRKATGQLLMIPVSAAGFGVRAGGQILGGAGRAVGSLLGGVGSILGGGAATGGAMVIAGTAAYYAKQAADKTNEGALTTESMTNLGPTNVALGEATQQLKHFSLQTTTTAKAITTFQEAIKSSSEERLTLAERGVKDKRMSSLSTDAQLLAFLKSMGKMTPQELHSLYLDMANQFGYQRADTIAGKYMSSTRGGTDPYRGGFGEIANPLLGGAASQTNAGVVGAFRNPLMGIVNPFAMAGANWSVDAATQEQVNQVWASIDERAKNQETLYNPKAGQIQKSMDVMTAMESAIKGAGTPGGNTVLRESVKNWERLVNGGNELGAETPGVPGNSFRIAGRDVRNNEDFYRALFDENNDATKGWRESQKAAGIYLEDYLNGGSGLGKKLIAAQYAIPSDVQRQVGSTALGELTLNSDTIKSVTSGESVATPTMTRKAIDEMTAAALKNAKSGDDVTTAFQDLKNNAGAASSYLYQLAQAAMSEAQQTEVYNAKQGGWMTEFTTRWSQVNKQLNNPLTNEDETKALRDERRAMTDDLRTRLQQIILAERSFKLQQDRAKRDFDKQMDRQIADASTGWQSAYTRGANQQQMTNSPGLIEFNAQEQLGTLKGQLSAVRKLDSMGLSKDARNFLQLDQPGMGNQAIRLAQTADKEWVKVQNQLAAERKKVVEALTKEFSTPFQRAEEDFKIATDDAIVNMKLMGDIATGTIKDLVKEASTLGHELGISDMKALTQAIGVYNSMQESDKQSKKDKGVRDSIAASEDYWAGRLNDTVPSKDMPGVPANKIPSPAKVFGNPLGEAEFTTKNRFATQQDVGTFRTFGYSVPSYIKNGSGSMSMDYSNNYNIGTLKVEAQNPEEMQRQLDAKTRRTNLRKGPGARIS